MMEYADFYFVSFILLWYLKCSWYLLFFFLDENKRKLKLFWHKIVDYSSPLTIYVLLSSTTFRICRIWLRVDWTVENRLKITGNINIWKFVILICSAILWPCKLEKRFLLYFKCNWAKTSNRKEIQRSLYWSALLYLKIDEQRVCLICGRTWIVVCCVTSRQCKTVTEQQSMYEVHQ